jgi:protein-S-isoprenylcysteine O-methyltransferase Ste14
MTTQTKSYVFVSAQFVLLISITLFGGKPTPTFLQLLGLGLILSGISICMIAIWQLRKYSLTAMPTPVQGAKLLQSGLYKKIRHPIYTGLIAMMSGVVISRFSVVRFLLLLCLIAVLYKKSVFEEHQLTKTFGKQYASYKTRTRRFL